MSLYLLLNFKAAFFSLSCAVLLFTTTCCGRCHPPLGFVGYGMDSKTKHLQEEVEDGNPSGHQGWDPCGSVEHRGIGVHVMMTLH